jgi:riboflavin kinase/FMN adenylyltransferase
MRIVDWDKIPLPDGQKGQTAVTIGVFDGIHRGHQLLIEKIVKKSAEFLPVVITFQHNPKEFFRKRDWKGDILSLNQKLAVFEHLGVGMVVLIDFSENFSKITGKEFLESVLRRLYPGFAVVGADFRCGYRGDTDAVKVKAFFREAGVPAEVVSSVCEGPHRVSSSRIRAAIAGGDMAGAARLLGRNAEFDLSGIVPVPVTPEAGISGAEALPAKQGGNWFFYETRSLMRLLPPPDAYPVLLRGSGIPAGQVSAGAEVMRAEAVIAEGGIFLSVEGDVHPARAEFFSMEFL